MPDPRAVRPNTQPRGRRIRCCQMPSGTFRFQGRSPRRSALGDMGPPMARPPAFPLLSPPESGGSAASVWCTWYGTAATRGPLWSIEIADRAASLCKGAGRGVGPAFSAKVRVAGSNPVVRSREFPAGRERDGQRDGPERTRRAEPPEPGSPRSSPRSSRNRRRGVTLTRCTEASSRRATKHRARRRPRCA